MFEELTPEEAEAYDRNFPPLKKAVFCGTVEIKGGQKNDTLYCFCSMQGLTRTKPHGEITVTVQTRTVNR